jgi:uncharacterized protein YlzI (FlbEa/FlbD family)
VIAVHRITQPDHELYVNPDLIQVIEANPDTVISETATEVAELVRQWRASIVSAVEHPSPAIAHRAGFGRLAAVVEMPRDTGSAD